MPITKTARADNGIVVTYHRATRLVVDLLANSAEVTVNSHADQQAALDNLPVAWQWRINLPAGLLAGDQPTILAEVEQALTTLESSPFYGGELGIDLTLSLAQLKDKKRAEITRDRLLADADHFDYSTTNAEGEQIVKAIRTADKDMTDLLVADARISKCTDGGMPSNWPGGWKAIDNTYVMISDRETWDAFFITMYDAGISNFSHSQTLKAALEAATTPEEIAALHW
jgi:hypothetical protein